ncbi:MAG: hypothetical protein Q7T23_13820 [Phenylobacterium sp.]|nr:hypothetical protein [Phenylobacterium sp.]
MIGHIMEAQHGAGDVQLVGGRVTGWARRLIGRGDQQPPAEGAEVEALVDILHHRPVMEADLAGRVDQDGGPQPWRQAYRRKPGGLGGFVGPGARGVDQDRRQERGLAGPHAPPRALAIDLRPARVGEDDGAGLLRPAHHAAVQPRHVEVSRLGLQQGGGDSLWPQDRRPPQGPLTAKPAQGGDPSAPAGEVVQAVGLVGAGDVQHRPRAQQAPGEAARRALEEPAAGGGQGPDRRAGIGGDVHRRRAASGVVAELRLLLHQGHPELAGELGG